MLAFVLSNKDCRLPKPQIEAFFGCVVFHFCVKSVKMRFFFFLFWCWGGWLLFDQFGVSPIVGNFSVNTFLPEEKMN